MNLLQKYVFVALLMSVLSESLTAQNNSDDLSLPDDQFGAPLYNLAIRNINSFSELWYFSSLDGIEPLSVREGASIASGVRLEYTESGVTRCVVPWGGDTLQLGYVENSELATSSEVYENARMISARQCIETFSTYQNPVTQVCIDSDLELVLGPDGVEGHCQYSEPAPLDCGNVAHGESEIRTRFALGTVPFGNTCQSQEQTSTCNNGVMSPWSGSYIHTTCVVEPSPEPSDCGNVSHGEVTRRVRFLEDQVEFGGSCLSEEQTSTCDNGVMSPWSGRFSHESCVVLAEPTLADCGDLKHGESQSRIRFLSATVEQGESCTLQTQTSTCNDGQMSDWSGSYTFEECNIIPNDDTELDISLAEDENSEPLYNLAFKDMLYPNSTKWYFASLNGSDPLSVRDAKNLGAEISLEYREDGSTLCTAVFGNDYLQLAYARNDEVINFDQSYSSASAFTAEQCLATFSTTSSTVHQKCLVNGQNLVLDNDGVTGHCIVPIETEKNCGDLAHGEETSRIRYLSATVLPGESCASEEQFATCNNGSLDFDGTFSFSSCDVSQDVNSAVTIDYTGTYYAVTIDYTKGKSRLDIGREYGEKIAAIYPDYEKNMDSLLDDVFTRRPWSPILEKVQNLRANLKEDYRDELEGLALAFNGVENNLGDGKLSRDELFLLNFFTDMTESGCSAVAAFGDASETGGTLIGRQVDWPEGGNRPLSKVPAVVTMKQGDKSFMGITFLGFMGVITAISDDNVFASSIYSETGLTYESVGRSSYGFDVRHSLENLGTADEVSAYLVDPIRNYIFDINIFVADPFHAMTVESNLGGVGTNIRRGIRYHDSVLHGGEVWNLPNTFGVVDSFLLEGNHNNHSNSSSNKNRLDYMNQELNSRIQDGVITMDDIQGISTFYTGTAPSRTDKGDIYNDTTIQIILFDTMNSKLKVFFRSSNTVDPDPEFIEIPFSF
ncbi:C45 family autoproteolytic acyltransferase/hydolase [Pseudobacteriovorax antillogorgiicola]|uniref:Uncharacterized protein n=1 Tax=Pseudobacteriovorax antillogorgiicola TaxID=1513793 RepID=A0A1Y6CDS1_9BACT|nr:C45 family autoproteolytic acyltransferase/hydolase [Pseudobacteriovorax antillogorgiicola]TCS47942.1 hypothetical protein EDD56_11953 [Pseudobacteriovorax antillogorgiicola]SMF58076.1 hypothetical protein SAMN06296036_11954 [Pseudobacteriovorax antillogorgiicola]